MDQLLKPAWLKIRPPTGKFDDVKSTLRGLGLVTVCEEAHCPNISECWSSGTATFMVMGDTCTRGCRFCNVSKARVGQPLDPDEPRKIAEAVAAWKLDYVVLTSVDRDDLPDQGASHFAACVSAIKKNCPGVFVEVLIPDFRGQRELIEIVVRAQPDVLDHNLETVRRLQRTVRDTRAGYDQSLAVLRMAKEINPSLYTKSSLMLGLGETDEEILTAFRDLRAIGVDIVTLGQYLRPSMRHLAVVEYVSPEKFNYFRQLAEKEGFLYCAAGPFVRSSYKAGELFMKHVLQQRGNGQKSAC